MSWSRPRIVAGLAGLSLALLMTVPVGAWSNGPAAGGVTGNGYGTHDWILDQAFKTFSGHVPSWVEKTTALQATDDPDTLFWRTNEHVYMEDGYGRGAVDRVTEYYARVITDLKAGDEHQASIDLGRLAHYYGDLLVPFHTAYAAVSQTTAHSKYELLVDAKNRTSTSAPEWQTKDRSPEVVTDIRAKAIAAAAYSRKFFPELLSEFKKNESVLDTRVSQLTGYVLTAASRGLGDIIHSIDLGVGNAPMLAKLVVKAKYAQPSSIEYQAFYITATDANGHVIEGLRIDVTWPSSADVPDGAEPTAHVFRAYTMDQVSAQKMGLPDGVAKATAYIDLGKHGSKQTVKVTATMRGHTVTVYSSYTAK